MDTICIYEPQLSLLQHAYHPHSWGVDFNNMLSSSKPPSENVIGWLSWDGMPAVVVRDPDSGGLTAWSSAEPGKRWRTVDVRDVASEGRALSESDWKAAFERWFPNPSLSPK